MDAEAMEEKKQDYEQQISALVGKRLKRVRYFEIAYETEGPDYFRESFSGHHLDFGCDLELEDGYLLSFIWKNRFVCYGVGVHKFSLSDMLLDPRVWEVTNDKHWVRLIGQIKTKIKGYWDWDIDPRSEEMIQYPQDIEFVFSDDFVVFFSASQYLENSDILGGSSDDIVVVFGHGDAKKFKIGPYRIIEESPPM